MNGDDGDHAENEAAQRYREAVQADRYRKGDAPPRQP
jgi:hypothetical protein